jgi:hypothetical protein
MKSETITAEAVLRGLEQRTFKKGEETWKQWLEKVSLCDSDEDLRALIHRGFSAQTEDVEEHIERLEFYLSLATRSQPQLASLDKLVHTTLCAKFLTQFTDQTHGFEPEIYKHPRVIVLLCEFYTEERMYWVKWKAPKYVKDSTGAFLKRYACWCAIWHPSRKLSDEIYFWAVSVLWKMEGLNLLFGYDYFQCITEGCLGKIRDRVIIESRIPASKFGHVCASMGPLAQFYISAHDFHMRLQSSD